MRVKACNYRGVAQSGSALVWGASGRRFKSGRPEVRTEFIIYRKEDSRGKDLVKKLCSWRTRRYKS